MAHGLLHLRDAQNILELSLRSNGIFVIAAAQSAQDITRFLLATNFDQPTRGFREEPNGCE